MKYVNPRIETCSSIKLEINDIFEENDLTFREVKFIIDALQAEHHKKSMHLLSATSIKEMHVDAE